MVVGNHWPDNPTPPTRCCTVFSEVFLGTESIAMSWLAFNADVTSLSNTYWWYYVMKWRGCVNYPAMWCRMWRLDGVSIEASTAVLVNTMTDTNTWDGHVPSLHFPSFCFPCSTDGVCISVQLVTQLNTPASFLIVAHLAPYLHSVSQHARGCFHVCWIGPHTGVNMYANFKKFCLCFNLCCCCCCSCTALSCTVENPVENRSKTRVKSQLKLHVESSKHGIFQK